MTETLFRSRCLALHNPLADQDITLKLSEYYKWRHANLWHADLQITGTGEINSYFYFEDRTETTTLTCHAQTIKTRNDGRENVSVLLNEDGTTSMTTIEDFNPPGIHGKIPDENLIRLRHEPCFPCSFTAFVLVQKNWNNLLMFLDPGDPPPEKPFGWSSWSYSVENNFSTDNDTDRDLYHINGVENVLWTINLQIKSALINSTLLYVHPQYTINGPVTLQNDAEATSTVTIDGYQKSASVALPAGLQAHLVWSNNSVRPI